MVLKFEKANQMKNTKKTHWFSWDVVFQMFFQNVFCQQFRKEKVF